MFIETVNQSVPEVTNTVKLLNEIYSGRHPGKTTSITLEAGNIRTKIRKEVAKFEAELLKIGTSDANFAEISGMLSRKSPFSGFKRQIVKDNPTFHHLSSCFD